MNHMRFTTSHSHHPAKVFGGGAAVGTLGGLIGLGGAEFRLPLLISLFGFAAVQAVILNKVMSLTVVAFAIPFRSESVPFNELFSHGDIVLTLLAGSLIGAWLGADWVTKLANRTLYRLIAVLLVMMALVLIWGHALMNGVSFDLTQNERLISGIVAGFGIGVVASVMGVAGGELLIPTIMLLFGADLVLAGSLSLVVSLPTMLAGLARYRRDDRFAVLGEHKGFVAWMLLGSVAGVALGGWLLIWVANDWLLYGLAAILLLSAYKVARHP